MTDPALITATAQIVAAFVAKQSVRQVELPALIGEVHFALKACLEPPAPAENAIAPTLTPAVPVKKSVTPEYLICLEDGRRFKSLKRHLGTLGMTPAAYRSKWGLPPDYPMVAPAYAARRSELAKESGLGGKRVAA